MQKSLFRPSERDWSRALAAIFAALTVALLALGWAQTAKLNRAVERVNAVSRKAFYETCELTESMSVRLRKLLVAGDAGQMQALLGEISREAQGAASNLALLPAGEETVSATLKFINQTGDFASALSVRLASGGAVSDDDYRTISTLSESAARLSVAMAGLLARVESGEAVLDGSMAAGDENLYPLTQPAADYPTLLYDGPFSDGARGSELKALKGLSEVSAEEAQRKLTAFFENVTDVTLVGESAIPADCYEFSFRADGYPMSAGVTRQGGEVLYALCSADAGEAAFTAEQLLDAARAFLLSRGFGAMEMSYYSSYDGILTVNYAAVQNDVVLYPDLVKVQLSMRDGAVVGLEASGYWTNHVPRTLELPAVSEEEAVSRIGARLAPLSARLCVIPTDSGEALCYEIRATDGSDDFLVYIDAATGSERELMQIVREDGGTLVQ